MAKLEDIPDDLCCPISREIFRDPVVASDGHTYSREAIENWLEKLSAQKVPLTSPFTRAELTTGLFPNLGMRNQVSDLLTSLHFKYLL